MRQAARFLTASLLISLAGCSALPAHNNTLIFGTAKDIGLGISTPSATDASVALTIGYKERSAAWVPLWANKTSGGTGQKDAHECAEAKSEKSENKINCLYGPKFLASDRNSQYDTAYDAYSTFASFGGAVAASGSPTGTASGSISLASFFATGVAAQNLSKQGSGLVAVAQGGAKLEPQETMPAFENAKIQVSKLLNLTAGKDDSKPVVNDKCLTALSIKFDSNKPSARFVWLAGRTPAEATKQLLANSQWNEADLNKLNGTAYQLEQAVSDEIASSKAKFDTANKTATPPAPFDSTKATTDASNSVCADVKPSPAAPASSPATSTSAAG